MLPVLEGQFFEQKVNLTGSFHKASSYNSNNSQQLTT